MLLQIVIAAYGETYGPSEEYHSAWVRDAEALLSLLGELP
jgi:hypothetical protein